MNILFVTAYLPVLHQHGGGVRMFHNIRLLAEKHSVRVLSFAEKEDEMEPMKSVESICDSVTVIRRIPDFGAHWFSLKPFLVREFGTPAMHKAVDEALRAKKTDVLQCEYLQMAQYKRSGIFSILTIHETASDNAYRAFLGADDAVEKFRLFSRWMATLNYEISMCNAFNRVVTMTTQDANYLRSYARRANIRAIPIGVDTAHFRPTVDPVEHPLEILFIGNFRHTPNAEAASFLLNEIAPYFPQLTFVIAGSHVPNGLSQRSNAKFTGYVGDTRKLFHSNTIFAAPMFSGTGQRVKLLEAFAMGSAVITTSLGAAGFPVVSGKEAVIADKPSEFRAGLRALVSSADLRSQIAARGQQMVLQHFAWERIGQQFLDVVEQRG